MTADHDVTSAGPDERPEPTCETCPFWSRNTKMLSAGIGDMWGECRRHAPRSLATDVIEPQGEVSHAIALPVPPQKYRNEWCGEHPERDLTLMALHEIVYQLQITASRAGA